LVYKQNEKTLSAVGADKLETMLRLRDWEEIADVKVDRREMEALQIARDYQETGVLKADDTTFANDATPAANKVDPRQIEQGNLLNVILQALEKRLGKNGGSVTQLSGQETSATIMSSDFVLQELDRIAASGPAASPSESKQILDDIKPSEIEEVLFGKGDISDEDDGYAWPSTS
jgi:hypothetical protein